MSQLDGKVIITTGGTQGIGEAVALHAAKAGAAFDARRAAGLGIGFAPGRIPIIAGNYIGLACEFSYAVS